MNITADEEDGGKGEGGKVQREGELYLLLLLLLLLSGASCRVGLRDLDNRPRAGKLFILPLPLMTLLLLLLLVLLMLLLLLLLLLLPLLGLPVKSSSDSKTEVIQR